MLGIEVRGGTSGSPLFHAIVGDGTTTDQAAALTVTAGVRTVGYAQVGNASPFVSASVNGGTPNADITKTTTASTSTGGDGGIGAYMGGSGFADMEFRALLTFTRALSTVEISRIVAYYGGGL